MSVTSVPRAELKMLRLTQVTCSLQRKSDMTKKWMIKGNTRAKLIL